MINLDAKEKLIAEIRIAFKDILLDDGISLHEARAIDANASAQQREYARKLDTDTRWESVLDEWIAKFYDVFPFFDLKGFRYYLPAYMVWSIRHFEESVSPSSDSIIYNLGPSLVAPARNQQIFASFDLAQCRAIYAFLKFMEANPLHADADAATEALEAYWKSFAA